MDTEKTATVEEKNQEAISQNITEKIIQRKQGKSRYIVRKELGRGAMGVIYKVHDQDFERISAMKVISTQFIDMEKRYYAFVREARLTAQLEHPNIVPIHHLGVIEDTGSPFYTMKLVDGQPLNEIINKVAGGDKKYVEKYTRQRLLNIFRSVCNAVAYSHSRGVIHRDIKPENIMVGQFGEVLLMDWGLAKPLRDKEMRHSDEVLERNPRILSDLTHFTKDGTIKGSPAYMSPEQAMGDSDNIDYGTDIFLLGSTLYHIFTHFPPYGGKNIIEIISKAERCNYPPPSKRNPKTKLPLALEGIIFRAMAPIKENRYRSVDDLVNDIDAFIAGRRACGRRVFSSAEHLVRVGDKARESYIVIEGSVEVYREIEGERVTIATLGPGEIIGEMAGITEDVRSANVIALETTDTLVITYELMKEELQKLPPWMEHIVFSLAERIRVLNEKIYPLKNRGSFPILHCLHYIYLSTHDDDSLDVHLSFSLKHVIEEIVLYLGVEESIVRQIISILIDNGLCFFNAKNELAINNMKDFELFINYARYKLSIKGGIKKIRKIRLSADKEIHFRTVAKKLANIFLKDTGTRTSISL